MKERSAVQGQGWARVAWLLGAITVSVLTRSMTANGSCPAEETVDMIDPVVTVIDGPGDPMSEQFNWSFLKRAYLEGPSKMVLNETGFELERVP